MDVVELGQLTKPSSSEYRTRSSYSTVYAFRDISISTPFYTLSQEVRVLPPLWKRRGRRSTFASLPPTTAARLKDDWSRSLFCHLVSSGDSSNSAGVVAAWTRAERWHSSTAQTAWLGEDTCLLRRRPPRLDRVSLRRPGRHRVPSWVHVRRQTCQPPGSRDSFEVLKLALGSSLSSTFCPHSSNAALLCAAG